VSGTTEGERRRVVRSMMVIEHGVAEDVGGG
jgi:hypothetical protein